jgi:hypothetical protein
MLLLLLAVLLAGWINSVQMSPDAAEPWRPASSILYKPQCMGLWPCIMLPCALPAGSLLPESSQQHLVLQPAHRQSYQPTCCNQAQEAAAGAGLLHLCAHHDSCPGWAHTLQPAREAILSAACQ